MRLHLSLGLPRLNVAMCGDDDVARNGGKTAKGALAAWSERHRGVSWNLWSDRLSLKSACGLRVSRPLRAVCRRPLEADTSGWPSAGVASGHRRTAHRGLGLGQMPRAWNVGGYFFCGWEERGCQYGSGAIGERNAAVRYRQLGKASGGFGLAAELVEPPKRVYDRRRRHTRPTP